MIPLYQLLDSRTQTRLEEPFFNTLAAARRTRRIFNRDAKDPLRYVVIPGPAHPKARNNVPAR